MYENLIQQAREVRFHAYCKYSQFAVGAALLCRDGTVYTGCNVENAAYPLCMCAERNAFGKAFADGKQTGDFEAIAIVGAQKEKAPDAPCYPCGACRQVLSELGGDALAVVLTDGIHPISELLPHSFTMESA